MSKQHRLDIDMGADLLAWLDEQSQASGQPRGAIARSLIQEARLARSEFADTVRRAVLALAATVEPSEQYDPADDPRPPAALGHLAELLGSAYAAQGIADALRDLWTAWRLEQRDVG